MSDDKNVRHRFTVPAADDVVNKWIENQSNLGFSLRVLIKAFVRSYGYKDATCLEFGVAVKKRGRPPKQANIKYNVMTDNNAGGFDFTDDLDEYDEPDNETAPETINEHTDTKIQPERQSSDSKAVPTTKPKPAVQTAANDVMGALRNRGKPNVAPVQDTADVSTDEDGFADPDSLFNV